MGPDGLGILEGPGGRVGEWTDSTCDGARLSGTKKVNIKLDKYKPGVVPAASNSPRLSFLFFIEYFYMPSKDWSNSPAI